MLEVYLFALLFVMKQSDFSLACCESLSVQPEQPFAYKDPT